MAHRFEQEPGLMRKAGFAKILAALIPPLIYCGPVHGLIGDDLADNTVQRYTVVVASSRGRCSGVVLAQDVVLTAAHCVQAAANLQIGGNIGGYYQTYPPFALSPVVETVRHPLYNPADPVSPDLAILKLAKPLPYRFIPAILNTHAVSVDDRLIVAGYGGSAATDPTAGTVLRMVLLRVSEASKDRLGLVGEKVRLGLVGEQTGSGTCGGDSGGPVFTYRGTHRLVALIVRGDCLSSTYGIALAPHYIWIRETTEKLSAP
jgi:hypothetical protein